MSIISSEALFAFNLLQTGPAKKATGHPQIRVVLPQELVGTRELAQREGRSYHTAAGGGRETGKAAVTALQHHQEAEGQRKGQRASY